MAVKPLSSARSVLEAIEVISLHQPVGVTSLAREMGITKSAAQRVLVTLAEAGWIAQTSSATTAWALTSKAMVVGSHFARSDLREQVLPVLTRLRSELGETAFLAVRDGRDVVYVAVLESTQRLRVSFPVGTAQPALHTAAGAVLAVDLAPDVLEATFDGDLQDAGFRHRIEEARRHGFAANLGEDVPDYHSVAAPVRGADGAVLGAAGVSAPAERMPREVASSTGRLLVELLAALHPL
jgi:IclR family acetate operon transcriptional repressor